MTEPQTTAGKRLQEWNDDFDALVYRPIRQSEGRVLNAAHEPPTIYETDLADASCSCDHGEKGPSDGRVCKHLAKAMLAHPDFTAAHELQTHELAVLVDRAATATRELENVRDQAQTARRAEQAAAVADAEADDGDDADDIDPVTALGNELADRGIDASKFDIWVDDGYGSLQFEQDGYLDDDEYGTLMDFVQQDGINWDAENERNYIPSDRIAEVLG